MSDPTATAPAAAPPAPKVLVVEDDLALGGTLVRGLLREGYRALGPVAEGMAAAELGLRERVPAAVMDIKLKGEVNGIEVARVLWQSLRTRVLFISTYHDRDLVLTAAESARCAFLPKPFSHRQLMAGLRALLALPVGPELSDAELDALLAGDATSAPRQVPATSPALFGGDFWWATAAASLDGEATPALASPGRTVRVGGKSDVEN